MLVLLAGALQLTAGYSCAVPCGNCTRYAGKADIRMSSSFVYRAEIVSCTEMYQYSKENDVKILSLGDNEAFGIKPWARDMNEDRFTYFQEMFIREDPALDQMNLDAQWVATLQGHLEDMSSLDLSNVREKFKRRSSVNPDKVVSVSSQSNQIVFYYRKDIFDKYNVTWPQTMDTFEEVVRTVQDGERKARGDDTYFGFTIPTDDSTNRITYMLATLLTTEGGGTVVDDTGKVTINNPKAAKVIRRWKNWFGDITPFEAFGMSTSDSRRHFMADKTAVIITWSDHSEDLNYHLADHPSWIIEAAPVPGVDGRGCSGDWSIAINSQSQPDIKAHAMQIVQRYVNNMKEIALLRNDQEPLTREVLDDETLMKRYCDINPILCNSHKKYPEFWDRVTHRPSGGCRTLYATCAEVIYRNIIRYFKSSDQAVTAESTIAQLETDLHLVLGYWTHTDLQDNDDEWTATRILLVVTCIVCGFSFIFLGEYIRREVRRMRKVHGPSIPISVLLGFVVLSFGIALSSILITLQSDTARGISTDLAKDVRVQSMIGMENLVSITVDNLRQSGRASTSILQITVASAKNFLGRMHLHHRSIVVIINRADGNVILSSNPSVQPENTATYSPYISGALSQYEWRAGESLIDPEITHTIDVSESWHVNAQGLDAGSENFAGFSWILVYMTPEDVIMGRADDAATRQLDLAVILTVLAVAIAVYSAVLISRPLVSLAVDMEYVRAMDVESLQKRDSGLTEVKALLAGFYSVCKILKEYKSFLPDALFDEETNRDSEVPRYGRRAPHTDGKAAIVFTDIQSSTEMWFNMPNGMKKAMRTHNTIMRRRIDDFEGYEVKTIGDAFMIAFETLHNATAFCLAAQEDLYDAEWPQDLLQVPLCKYQQGAWKGLRVRMGVHYGELNLENSPMTGRSDYMGTTVNKAARLESSGVGGGIGMTEDTFNTLDLELLDWPSQVSVGSVQMKGLPNQAYCMVIPKYLKERLTYIENQFHKQQAANPLVRKEASVTSTSNTSRNTPSLPKMLKDNLQKSQGTVGHVRVSYDSLSGISSPLVKVNEVLSATVHCVEMCGGTVVSVCSGVVVAAWNTTKNCTSHVMNSVRFIRVFQRQLKHTDGEWFTKCNLGLASGGLLYGNAGSRDLRFSLVIGSVVETAGYLAETAREMGTFCLLASLPGHADLTLDTSIKKVIRPVDTWQAPSEQRVMIYEPRIEHLSKLNDLEEGSVSDVDEVSPLDEWGWAPDGYSPCFHEGDYKQIRSSTKDPVLLSVASRLEGTAFRTYGRTAGGFDMAAASRDN